jgi:hypothetical protein
MTSKSVLAILRNSNLREFCNFSYFSFSDQDLDQLKALAFERGLNFVTANKTSYCGDQCGPVWIKCDRGNHNWFCLEPNVSSRSFDQLDQ